MADKDREFVYVDINGNEVDKDDSTVQTRYTRGDFKALDKEMVFGNVPAKPDAPVDAKGAGPASAAKDEDAEPVNAGHRTAKK